MRLCPDYAQVFLLAQTCSCMICRLSYESPLGSLECCCNGSDDRCHRSTCSLTRGRRVAARLTISLVRLVKRKGCHMRHACSCKASLVVVSVKLYLPLVCCLQYGSVVIVARLGDRVVQSEKHRAASVCLFVKRQGICVHALVAWCLR